MNTQTNAIESEWPVVVPKAKEENKQQRYVKVEDLNGVYRREDGLYRAAIRPLKSNDWYVLGHFIDRDTAAYVFNVYALTMGLEGLLNKNIKPKGTELEQWRERDEKKLKREVEAKAIYEGLQNAA